MSSMTFRHGIAAGLGAAAGALAAAAFVSTAPIASADDTDFLLPLPAASVDAFALPALVPTNEYTSEFTIGEGSTEVTYDTTWDGSGLPTTTTTTETLPTGEEAFGFGDESSSIFSIGTNSYESVFEAELLDITSAAGNQFEFVAPTFEFFSPAV
ncbi:MAG TPA: hypothetical protein VKI00_10115 [Mycobacterium sp.]|uniref:hypothetical protein n=1 Tax=Mycobacterium sp. TaxID=1785 RepID=UPI002B8C2DDB|nr:hypothetical protein [Mycobacterium sp.]HME75985.1 hypothetical protein [Mycobacterium sp.]